MSVTAKFKVSDVVSRASYPTCKEVTLHAVAGEENKPWSEYTPAGTITMQITNPAAHGQFEVGKTYLLTFEPADAK